MLALQHYYSRTIPGVKGIAREPRMAGWSYFYLGMDYKYADRWYRVLGVGGPVSGVKVRLFMKDGQEYKLVDEKKSDSKGFAKFRIPRATIGRLAGGSAYFVATLLPRPLPVAVPVQDTFKLAVYSVTVGVELAEKPIVACACYRVDPQHEGRTCAHAEYCREMGWYRGTTLVRGKTGAEAAAYIEYVPVLSGMRIVGEYGFVCDGCGEISAWVRFNGPVSDEKRFVLKPPACIHVEYTTDSVSVSTRSI